MGKSDRRIMSVMNCNVNILRFLYKISVLVILSRLLGGGIRPGALLLPPVF